VIPLSEKPKLERLYEKYGVGPKEVEDPESEEIIRPSPAGGLGDFDKGV
jgi:hypothetical protein